MTLKPAARPFRTLLWILTAIAVSAGAGAGGETLVLAAPPKPKPSKPWVWQNPLPVGNTLHSVAFGSASLGWAVGDGGAAIVTHNGGATWTAATSGENRNLRGVSVRASGQVWAVGDGGVILKSATGATFSAQQSGTTRDLFGVHFVCPMTGWAAGDGVILSTHNGGATWAPQLIGDPGLLFTSIVFANATTGWASGVAPGVYKTVDGGATWTRIRGAFQGFYGIWFSDALNGWGVDFGSFVYHTTDGGATWVSQSTPINPFVGSLMGVHFADAVNGWAVGVDGAIVHTTNGGASWTLQPPQQPSYALRSVWTTDASHAQTVGVNGQILTTPDAGTTWTDPFPGSREQLIRLAVLDENEAWALSGLTFGGGGTLLHTADGGTHWTLLPATFQLNSVVVSRYAGMSGPVLWATSENRVLKSFDRGQNWTILNVPTTQFLDVVSFPDPMHGWAAGSQGILFATADGGATWTEQNSGVTGDILHLRFVNATTGWLSPSFGGSLRGTKDGGATWTAQFPSGANLNASDLAVISDHRVVVGGSFGTGPGGGQANLARTADGGATWTFLQIGDPFTEVRSVSFVTHKKGWLLLDDNSLYRTSDGGATWSPLPDPTVQNFRRIRFANPNVGWIVGEGGSILKTTTGGQ